MLKEADLRQFYGTQGYHRFNELFANYMLSDGAKYVAEKAGAYWLMEAIASYYVSLKRHPMLKDMQFWTLLRNDKGGATLTCRPDSNYPNTVEQQIEYTDFPLDRIDLWVSAVGKDYLIYLPSEH